MASGRGFENMYDNPEIKKTIHKDPDWLYDNTRTFQQDTRIIAAGASGTGKTNFLMQFLATSGRGRHASFDHVYLCYKTDEDLYDWLFEKLGSGKITAFKSVAEFPSVNTFQDLKSVKLKRGEKRRPRTLIIFDDCVNDKGKNDIKKMQDYFTYSRKKGCVTMFLTQSWFGTPIYYRHNCDYAVICGIRSDGDLHRICQDCAIPKVSPEQMIEMYYECKNDAELRPFIICRENVPINKRISYGIDNYKTIDPTKEVFNDDVVQWKPLEEDQQPTKQRVSHVARNSSDEVESESDGEKPTKRKGGGKGLKELLKILKSDA